MNRNGVDQTSGGDDGYSRPKARFDGEGVLEVRASAAGDCRRALWYEATEREVSNPPTGETLTLLEAGNALEPVVLRAMGRSGWELAPADSEDPERVSLQIAHNLRVTGHPDATGRMPLFEGEEMVVEVKTRGPEAHKRWQVLGAERSHPESVAQAALYTYGTFGEPRDAVMAVMDTATRTWDYEIVPASRIGDAFHGAKARLYALSENYALHGADPEALPDRDFTAGHWRCNSCPYLNTCLPGMQETEGGAGEPADDERKEVSMEEARAAAHAYAKARDALREPEQARRQALDTLLAWMRGRGQDRAELDGHKVSLVRTTRYSVDHKKLNALLDPKTRAGIVTEQSSEHVRVTP